MHIIDVGRRRFNLKYLIMDEQCDGTPGTASIPVGGVRVVMRRGHPVILDGPDAASYLQQVRSLIRGPAAIPGGAAAGPGGILPATTLDAGGRRVAVEPAGPGAGAGGGTAVD